MVCVCCERPCDATFSVHGHLICFGCTMNKSHADIMAVIQERLHINVKSWAAFTPASS